MRRKKASRVQAPSKGGAKTPPVAKRNAPKTEGAKKIPASFRAHLARLRALYLSLPGTSEVLKWGSPHMMVGDKILGSVSARNGAVHLTFKLERAHAAELVAMDPRVVPAKYVGHKGWITLDATRVTDWEQLRKLVLEGYRLVAPKALLKRLDANGTRA